MPDSKNEIYKKSLLNFVKDNIGYIFYTAVTIEPIINKPSILNIRNFKIKNNTDLLYRRFSTTYNILDSINLIMNLSINIIKFELISYKNFITFDQNTKYKYNILGHDLFLKKQNLPYLTEYVEITENSINVYNTENTILL